MRYSFFSSYLFYFFSLLLVTHSPLVAQSFPPDFGKPKLRIQSIQLPDSAKAAPRIALFNANAQRGSQASLKINLQDDNGINDLSIAYLLLNNQLSSNNSCFLEIDPHAGTIRLANDSASGWLSPTVIAGTDLTVQNSQCQITGTSFQFQLFQSGEVVSRLLELDFFLKPAFAGARTIFGFAQDHAGLNSGWQTLGSVTVASRNVPRFSQNTPMVSTPQSGIGRVSIFHYISDADGQSDISAVRLVLGRTLDPALGCFFEVDTVAGVVRLANANGNGWVGQIPTNSSAQLRTSRCTIVGNSVTFSSDGLGIGIGVSVESSEWAFQPPAGFPANSIYGEAADRAGNSSGWSIVGRFGNAVGGVQSAPAPPQIAYREADLQGGTAEFVSQFDDANGAADLSVGYFLAAPRVDGAAACLVEYDFRTSQLRLAGDDGNNWLPKVITLGAFDWIENSQCRVNGWASSISGRGAQWVEVRLSVTYKSSFQGWKTLYSRAIDNAAGDSGWTTLGRLLVAGRTPPRLSVLSQQGFISSRDLRLQVTLEDSNGLEELESGRITLRPRSIGNLTASLAGLCVIDLFAPTRQARLWNDAGSAHLPTIVDATTAVNQPSNTVTNSQCSVKRLFLQTVKNDGLLLELEVSLTAPWTQVEVYSEANDFFGLRTLPTLQGSVFVSTLDSNPYSASVSGSVDPSRPEDPDPGLVISLSVMPRNANDRIRAVTFVIGSPTDLANSCHFRIAYEGSATWFVPSGNTYQGIPNTNGIQPASVSTANCILRQTNASMLRLDSASGSTIPLFVELAGNVVERDLYMQVENVLGVQDSFRRVGYVRRAATGPATIFSYRGNGAGTYASGGSAYISFYASHPTSPVTTAYILVGEQLNAANACFVQLNALHESNGSPETFQLANDAGTNWVGTTNIGGATLRNRQCVFSPHASVARRNDRRTQFAGLLSGLSTFGNGKKRIFAYVVAANGESSGWLQVGTWDLDVTTASLAITRADWNGLGMVVQSGEANTLRSAAVLVGTTPASNPVCHAEYRFDTSTYWLYPTGETTNGQSAPANAVSTVLENANCRLNIGGSISFAPTPSSGSPGSVLFDLTLKTPFVGTYASYGRLSEAGGVYGDWKVYRTYTVLGPTPPVLEMTNNNPAAMARFRTDTFEFALADRNGQDDLQNFYFLVRTAPGTNQACFIWADLRAGVVRMAADSGQAWLPNAQQFGNLAFQSMPLPIENSQCRLSNIGFASTNGASVFRLTLTPLAPMAGTRNIEANVQDSAGLNSGWRVVRTISVN